MATNRVKGITIEIGGDTTGLDKALSGTNKSINSTKKELKDVERLLKLDPGNTELLAQKQRLLNQEIGQTKEKLDTLKKAQAQVQEQFDKGEITQEQYDALQREIIQTERELKDLEKAAQTSNTAMSKISDTADKVASATGKLAEKTRTMSMAAAGVTAGLVGLAVKAGQSADEINTLSKQTGVATDTIQKFKYASDLIDVSFDTVAGSLKKLTNNMDNATKGSGSAYEAFQKLGVSFTDSSGALRNNEEVFYEIIDALGQVENETERDAIAMDLFGKSATDLNPLILGGAEAFKELGQQAEESGVILSQDALDGANAFNDGLDKIKATLGGTLLSMGSELAESLVPAMEKLGEVIANVCKFIAAMDGDTLTLIVTISAVVAAVSPVLTVISTLSSAISALMPVVSALWALLVANPIGIVIAAIAALVALIAVKGDEIQVLLNKLDAYLQGVFAKDWTEVFGPVLGGVINNFMSMIKTTWDALKKVFDGLIDFIRGVFTGDWDRAWKGVQQIFKGYFEGLANVAKAPLNAVISLINGLFSGINATIGKVNSLTGSSFGTIEMIPLLAKGGTVQNGSAIVGEAGAELLSVSNGAATVTPLSGGNSASHTDITDLLQTYLPYLANDSTIVLDTGVLVGATAPAMNNALGKIAMRTGTR